MGNQISNIFVSALSRLTGRGSKEFRIIMVGLDYAGKTTMLYKLRLGEVITTIPTIGFNVESVHYKNIVFTLWDVAGQERMKPLWQHYFSNTQGIIYVVDSADMQRLEESKIRLDDILAVQGALTRTRVAYELGLPMLRGRPWHIQSCSAISGEGLHEGLDWLSMQMCR